MMRVIDFKIEHLELMNVREIEEELLKNESYFNRLKILSEKGVNHTLIIDDIVIMCGGSVEISEGVYEVWQIPSNYVANNVIKYSKCIKEWFSSLCKIDGVVRIQTIAPDDKLHDRWLSFLGMQKEGVMRKYFNNKDYSMWSKVNGS